MAELYHHGIIGQRWGVRRYRNKDGTLTEAGKRRLSQESKGKRASFNEQTGKIDDNDPANLRRAESSVYRNVANDYNQLSNIGNNSANISRTMSQLSRDSADRKRIKIAKSEDISQVSDKDLQQKVNRMNLERNYYRLKAEEIELGRDHVTEVLAYSGALLAIGASAAQIAAAIYSIKS